MFILVHFLNVLNHDSFHIATLRFKISYLADFQAFSGLLGLEDLTIERCNLTSISGQTLSYLRSLVTLRLHHLSIVALEDQNFRKLSNLRGLDIDHWLYLEYISPLSFQGLDLHWLSITNTNITSVPSASFKNLVHLTHLNLSYNPITTLEPWAFKDLLRLKELIMVSTGLMTVEPHAFGGLRQIRVLNFSSNDLQTLEEGSFHSVNSLETLRVDGNPLMCDCRLLWILQRRKTLNFDGRVPVCAGPVEVQGVSLSAFTDSALFDHFTCQKPKIRNRKMQQVMKMIAYMFDTERSYSSVFESFENQKSTLLQIGPFTTKSMNAQFDY